MDDYEATRDCIKVAFEGGINYFDTAELYGYGIAETNIGRALKELNIPRDEIVVSTKVWRINEDKINAKFLSRKHVIEGVKNSLKRL